MLSALLIVSALTTPVQPIVRVGPPVFDTAHAESFLFYGGIQGPNRALRTGYEFGIKYEAVFHHPYMLRLGVDYSEAQVSFPFSPVDDQPNITMAGRKQSFTLNGDLLAYRGRHGVISYVGAGITFGFNSFGIRGPSMDSLGSAYGFTEISLNDKLGYRVFIGLRFQELFTFEMAYQQVNPDFVLTRPLGNGTYGVSKYDGPFSVARVNFGYLLKL